MRKIRFRAWDISEKCWIDIKSMGFEGSRKSNELWYVQACDENERDIDPPYFPEMGDIELMQFTGLHDKNGREIYEGDIVKHQKVNYTDCGRTEIESVDKSIIGEFYLAEGLYPGLRFKSGRGTLFWPGSLNSEDFEVIGDRWEHPHLLERSVEE